MIRYTDLSPLGLCRLFPTLGQLADLLPFTVSLPRIVAGLRRAGAADLFVRCGADGWFLWNVWLMQKFLGRTELYLVDDIKQSAEIAGNPVEQRIVRALLSKVLCRALNLSVEWRRTRTYPQTYNLTL